MTIRYCVTCQKAIRGHAIGAHIQHKHKMRAHAPVVEPKPKLPVPTPWQVSKTTTDTLDSAKRAEALHNERLFVLHEKTLDVILLLGKTPALVPVAEKLLAAVVDTTKRIPFWLLSGLNIAPVLLASTYSNKEMA